MEEDMNEKIKKMTRKVGDLEELRTDIEALQ